MKLFLKFIVYILLVYKPFADDFIMTVTGIDQFPSFVKVDENTIFMTFNNRAQFTTNTSMFGFGVCEGTVEIINGDQKQNILCTITDSYKNKGYLKAIPASRNKNVGNMIGDRLGSSIASWQWVGGDGPFEELKGVIMTGAYFQMGKNKHGDGNFIWRGKAEGLSAKLIERINNYKRAE